jgi:hypothetical protein
VIAFKEEFVGCPKWVRAIKLAGSDAIVMWLALKLYAATHPTNGFIPDEEIGTLRGAPRNPRKALKALVDCGALNVEGNRGAGLVDQAPHGWLMHDYTEHANSSEHELLRREKARDRKRQQRERERLELEARLAATGALGRLPPLSVTGVVTERDCHDVTGVTVTRVTEAVTSGACPPVPVRSPAPNPTQPNQQENSPPPPMDLSGSANALPVVVVVPQSAEERIPCPPDLKLTDAQRAQLQIGVGASDYQIDQLELRFRMAASTHEPRPRSAWQSSIGRAVTVEFSNGNRRPPKSPDDAANETDSQTRLRLKSGPRQPSHSDHSDPEQHFAAIGANEV